MTTTEDTTDPSRHPSKLGLLALTEAEIAVVETALFDYQMGTETYLQSYRREQTAHGPCCETYKVQQAIRDEGRVSLEARLATIDSVLERIHRFDHSTE